jgi:hypothetical protein
MRLRSFAAALVTLGAACHVRTTVLTTHPGPERTVAVTGGTPRALGPTIVVAPDGRLRFVEPLRCPADIMVDIETAQTVRLEPNLATAVVGIIVTVAGAVTGVSGLARSSDGLTWLGAGGAIAGLPFAIGPWLGNGDTDVPLDTKSLRKTGGEVACGERAVTARHASVRSGRFQAFGTVDADGTFSVSPYTWVDVFDVAAQPALDLTADLVDEDGIRTITTVLEASAFAGTRQAFLDGAGIDGRVEKLRKVPSIEPAALQVSRHTIAGSRFLRVILPVVNHGPGDAWQLRGVIESAHPEVDGRLIYIGHLAPGASVDAEIVIPLSVAADQTLGKGTVEIAVKLREAHGAAPEEEVRFQGKL